MCSEIWMWCLTFFSYFFSLFEAYKSDICKLESLTHSEIERILERKQTKQTIL